MDPSEFIRLLKTDHYSPADLEEVNDMCRNYPMFSLAHMLKVRIKEALGQDKEADLKVAAVYSSDRKKLFQLVTEVVPPSFSEPEEEILTDQPVVIQFSEEPHHQADVIIEQHAPYAGVEPAGDLLELDEEGSEDSFILDLESDDSTSEVQASEATGLVEQKQEQEQEQEQKQEQEHEQEQEESANDHLIRSFIIEEPGAIRADMKSNLKGDVSLSSIREHDGFITDTLAKIYVKQGLYAKAIYAYEKLSLKYPEKSAYFAAQIEKIKNINHS